MASVGATAVETEGDRGRRDVVGEIVMAETESGVFAGTKVGDGS